MVPHREGGGEEVNGCLSGADTHAMATIAARVPRTRAIRVRSWWIVSVLTLLVGAAYALMRVPTAL
jgi:hypothetical protein